MRDIEKATSLMPPSVGLSSMGVGGVRDEFIISLLVLRAGYGI